MPQYPKFQARVRNTILDPALQQQQTPGYAVVMTFDAQTNTCDIVTAMPGSDEIGEVYTNVPIPLNSGVQTAAPKVGTMCWIAFRDGTRGDPYITHFFDLAFSKNRFDSQYKAVLDTPRFMISM
jgi:hypothetical protein